MSVINGVGIVVGYGQNNNASQQVVRATSGYRFYTSAAQRSIASSSALDTSSGTGAQQVSYVYYDNNMNGPFTDTVTLNGTSAVNTNATNIMFLESASISQTGTDNTNDGTITFFDNVAGGGGTISCIAPGDNFTFWSHHFVAANAVCHIHGITVSASFQTGTMVIFQTGSPLVTNVPQVNISGTLRHDTVATQIRWDIPIYVAGPNFFFLAETPDTATALTNINNIVYANIQVES